METVTNKNSNQSTVITEDEVILKKSVCGVMKDNTINVIQKLESEIPSFYQGYSDLYTRYLHSIQDIFGTCSLAEKQYFDKMDIDQNILNMYDDYMKFVTNVLGFHIDLSADFVRTYIQFRLSSIDSWDKYMHEYVNMYAKFLAKFLQKGK